MKNFLILTIISLCTLAVQAQYIEPVSLTVDNNPQDIATFPNDLNGNKCARLNIICQGNTIEKVEGNVIGELYKEPGRCIVFLTQSSKMVKIFPTLGQPVLIDFKNLGVASLCEGKSYELLLNTFDGRKKVFSYNNDTTHLEEEFLLENEKTLDELNEMANTGNVDAKAALGAIYFKGDGVDRNLQLAYRYFKEAADKGNARGLNGLGIFYEEGECVKKNIRKAFELYKQASDKGFAQAYMRTAICYEYGEGTEIDYQKAAHYYKLAGEKGVKGAYGELAMMLLFAVGEGTTDKDEFISCISKGMSVGDSNAFFTAGYAYRYGIFAPQDFNRAFECFQKASELGNIMGTVELAICYHYGIGTVVDNAKSFMFFKIAANDGDDEAQYFLGECYRNGYGTIVSKEKALYWYEKAAKQQNEDAINALNEYK